MLHPGEHPLATDSQPNRGALAIPAAASIQNGYPRRDRDFASDGFHQPAQPQRQGVQVRDFVLIRVCVDIEKKIADLNRCKSCLDALDQLPLVVECGDVHRVFKGRFSNEKRARHAQYFHHPQWRGEITSVKAMAGCRLNPRAASSVGKTSITDIIESTLPPARSFRQRMVATTRCHLKGIALTTPQRCVIGTADGIHRTAVIREEKHNRIVG